MLVTAVLLGMLAGLFMAGSAAVMADWRERNPGGYADFRSALTTLRRELTGMVGLNRRDRARSPAVYASSHSSVAGPTPPAATDEPIARAQRPVA
jgi:hypothetical protein